MIRENLEQAIAAAHHRLENLAARASHIEEPNASMELLQEAITETAISLEELHVLAEELTEQNEELVATRHLVEAERQSYQDLFNFAPDGYLVTDVNGVIQEANYAAAKLLQVRQSYLIGKPLSVFIHQTELPKFRSLMGKLQEQQEQKSTEELRIFHNDGKIDFPAEMTVALTEGNCEGKKAGLRWLFRDISDRLQAQQKIREQAALLDITTDAILVRDLQNQILYWNQGAEKIYGWRAEEAIGKNTWELLSPEASPQLAVALKTVLEHGSWFGELRKVTRNGKSIIINSRWTLIYDAVGAPKSIMTVDSDITEKKQLEIQLQRAQRLESLGTLTGAIAHDLNNILSPMITVAQLLPLKHPELSESSVEMLKLLETNSKRGNDLVKQIESFTRNFQGMSSSDSSTPPIVDQIKLPTGNGELILVVDEEAAITQITKTTLEIHNYRVLIAHNVIEALTLYTQHQQDIKLVLMDLMMSSMTGGSAIRTLQIMNPQVQIIAMSGLAAAEALTQATMTGIPGFLAKPFTADELLNSIHDVLVSKTASSY
ncbi:PAS domain S-box protein [Nodularia sphaerocarpa]|uniref:hybrid sensor histidine kinase/response regulator n=1 Tax=Nodularia sphaerocarpa TaxID=137816 RepID=UPI001EFA904C|nr:PAS domain S-box protein [Nodularia sphaerocarpa]MDB9373367.1 PAS domain S-box protein [Nodularia sphaerocarpa CS-585]MDB9377341.1 PAS domain S-box protein [Nodularia sphaerocarpa CS-585A2]ULP74088.1 Blue-light-activated protein [Nodularia sphaerocarpa UHCC 0038]